jgi:hypothetical protein
MSDYKALVTLGTEKFNVREILRHVDNAASDAYSGSERNSIALVARLIRAQQTTIDSLQKQLEEARAELDEASPFMQCARCGKPTRMHKLVAEEGDEWECFPCNDRENKRERELAALQQQGEK